MKKDDLLWLAGLLEGEGSFMKGVPSKPNSPIISCQMTDEDIIERVANLFSVSYCKRKVSEKNPKWNDLYSVMLRGKRAVAIMQKLKPLMVKRRRLQIEAAIDDFNPDGMPIKLTRNDVKNIKKMLANKISHQKIADQFNISRVAITDINTGRTWSHVK